MTVESVLKILKSRLGDRLDEFLIPPPVFQTMGGEFLQIDLERGILITQFPVLERFLNPYGAMQGGIVAAAVDNTLGPLSMLVAPPNVTRRLEMKYSRPVTPEVETIQVAGKFEGRTGRTLAFSAAVRDPSGNLLARGKASHWVLEGSG